MVQMKFTRQKVFDALIRGIAVVSFSYLFTNLLLGEIPMVRALSIGFGAIAFAAIWILEPFGKPESATK